MSKVKFTNRDKVTVVNENDLSHHIDGEQSENNVSRPEVKVVDEPLSTSLLAKWFTLIRSPLGFLTSIILAMMLGYFIGSASYRIQKVRPDERGNRNETVVTELAQQLPTQEVTAEYYDLLTNNELREEGLNFVTQLRKFLLKWGIRENQIALSLMTEMDAAMSEKERQDVWQRDPSTSDATPEGRTVEYEKRLKTKAILLRNELISRLPGLKRNNRVEHFYNNAGNPVDMRTVLDDITFLTESLLSP